MMWVLTSSTVITDFDFTRFATLNGYGLLEELHSLFLLRVAILKHTQIKYASYNVGYYVCALIILVLVRYNTGQ